MFQLVSPHSYPQRVPSKQTCSFMPGSHSQATEADISGLSLSRWLLELAPAPYQLVVYARSQSPRVVCPLVSMWAWLKMKKGGGKLRRFWSLGCHLGYRFCEPQPCLLSATCQMGNCLPRQGPAFPKFDLSFSFPFAQESACLFPCCFQR